MMLDQIGITVFGLIAITLINSRHQRWRYWGAWSGVISQPFWFLSSWMNQQWGIFLLSFIFLASWIMGIRNNR